METTE